MKLSIRVSSGMLCPALIGEELIILSDGAAKLAEIGNLDERSQDRGLCGVDFVFRDGAKHSFTFSDEVER